jgi:hypothetical protein
MKTVYAVLWIGWIAYFLAVEFTAIGTGHDQYTLSDFVWRAEEVSTSWTALRFFVIAGCVWLLLHLGFHLFT